ncbi:MAG: CotH kinase family protein [Paludibacteraceae bacterium]|nr:CotH kinase family protein [Paludibacteraceae bacterium]
MKKIFLYILFFVASAFVTVAQQRVNINGNGFADSFDLNDVDSVRDNGVTKYMDVNYPIDKVDKITFSQSKIADLSKADNSTNDNKLLRFYFTSAANDGKILADIEGELNGNTFTVLLPYVTDFSSLVSSFEATGKVYMDGDLQKSGVTSQNFSKELTYKVLSSNGDVNTYKVKVYNTGLPVVTIKTPEVNIPFDDWSELGKMTIVNATDNKLQYAGALSVKTKGSRYSTEGKRSFNLKMDSKAALLGMSNGKRWILLSNKDDNSLLRTQAGFYLGSQLNGLAWTPKSEPVELVVGDQYMGSYLLCEQIRVSEGRVASGFIWEVTDDFDATDVHFQATESKLNICSVDPEVSQGDADFLSAQKLINDFETALYGSSFKDVNNGYRKYIDVNSFVDWFLANEIGKNAEAAFVSDCYFTINQEGKIVMGPLYSFEEFFGNKNESAEGFVVKKTGWIARMFEDPYFVKLVADRLKEIASTESSLLEEVSAASENVALSFVANEKRWDNFKSEGETEAANKSILQQETNDLKNWISARYKWLNLSLGNESMAMQSENATNDNQILTFSIKKNDSNYTLLQDYTATISNDSVKAFIPYLYQFDLIPEFTVSNGASVYVDGSLVESGKTSVNFVHPVTFRVVSSNGYSRAYIVSVYNTGLPVIVVNTEGNKDITDKINWLDSTLMQIYQEDGKLLYDASPDNVQIKGRGNSTWDTGNMSGKAPYAIRLNKKSELFGMLEHKRWVLMANYYDATFFRNEFANYLGKRFTKQDWVPSGYNVELVLNGVHKGNYYFCEQSKINDARVPGNYLIEADTKALSGQMQGQQSHLIFNTKDPELDVNSEEFQYVKNNLDQFENALFSTNFTDPQQGYKKYVDLQSFVDWYVVKELSKDVDGNMHTSCFYHIMDDGLIRMGPLWDFDIAFGGNPFGGDYNTTSGYYITTPPISDQNAISWFNQLMTDPEFISMVKLRINEMIDHWSEIENYIDTYTDRLKLSATANTIGNSSSGGFGGFGGFGGWGGSGGATTTPTTFESYQKEVDKLKTFVKERLAWLKSDLDTK